ncbi:MAG: rhomboid family intramembrane serine protease [Hyphomicrobiales bacterium]
MSPRHFDSPRMVSFGGGLTPAVKTLLIANVSIWLFELLAGVLAHVRLDRLFGLVPYDVTHHFFLWQLVSYMFLHDPSSLFHIGFNMLALWMFGGELEDYWGTDRFTRFYFVTGIGAGVCTTLVSWNSYVATIGASGAIYGLLAAYGLLFPDREILLYFLLPIKAKYFVLILGLIAFWSSLSSSGDGIAHIAHLGGMLFGWLYIAGLSGSGRIGYAFRSWYSRWRHERIKKRFKVYYKETRGEDDDEPEA